MLFTLARSLAFECCNIALVYIYGVAGILDTRILREGVAALLQCRGRGSVLHVHALSTITGYLLRTVARYAEVHSALQAAGEAARL